MSPRFPAPALSTSPPGRPGTSPSSSSQEPSPPDSGDMAHSSCAGPPGRARSPCKPQALLGLYQTPSMEPLCRGRLVPLLCFTKKGEICGFEHRPWWITLNHPIFPRSDIVHLPWRRPCAGSPRPQRILDKIIRRRALVTQNARPAGNPIDLRLPSHSDPDFGDLSGLSHPMPGDTVPAEDSTCYPCGLEPGTR